MCGTVIEFNILVFYKVESESVSSDITLGIRVLLLSPHWALNWA